MAPATGTIRKMTTMHNASNISYPFSDIPPLASPMSVAPSVYWVRLPLPFSLATINSWIIEEKNGLAIIDSGINTDETLKAWEKLEDDFFSGRTISRVFSTHMHPDHSGVAGWLADKYQCRWWVTSQEFLTCRLLTSLANQDAPDEAINFYRSAGWSDSELQGYVFLNRKFGSAIQPVPDSFRRIRDGENIIIGSYDWQVICTSGHSREHATFYCRELKLLISGDQVLPKISPNISVFFDEPDANPMKEWLDSLLKIKREVPNDVLVLPAHGEPFVGLHERLDNLYQSHLNSIERLRGALEMPRRVVDLFEVLFSKEIGSDPMQKWLATGETRANLNYLLASREVVVDVDLNGIHWFRNA